MIHAAKNEPLGPTTATDEDDEFSLLALGSVLLRWRKTIIVLGLAGAVLGAVNGLRQPRMYVSSAIFVPEGNGDMSGLAAAANQLGLRAPSTNGAWGPPVYVELLHSRPLLEPLAEDTLTVPEQGGRRIPVMDLLAISDPNPARRVERTVATLRGMIEGNEARALNAVRLTVSSRWPSVSFGLADRLVHGINQFNIDTRKTQAAAERQFAEAQAAEAERALRQAEDRMQSFLQQNRGLSDSPDLRFQRDRLQRDINLRQQTYTTLLMSGQDAKLRELRDTPVITVIEEPRLPVVPESRKVAIRTLLGGLGGAVIAMLFAFLAQGFARARGSAGAGTREFFQLLEDATPRLLKRFER